MKHKSQKNPTYNHKSQCSLFILKYILISTNSMLWKFKVSMKIYLLKMYIFTYFAILSLKESCQIIFANSSYLFVCCD